MILDTGPLVAYLNASDQYHEWTVRQFSDLYPPFLTCEAVLTEACFLLRHYKRAVSNIFELLSRELIIISFNVKSEHKAISRLMKKYGDIPMSLADACLVRMAEQMSNSVICTLDNDFRIYRIHKRNVVPTLMPKISE
jgi:predicted nucleic acid-binding protein